MTAEEYIVVNKNKLNELLEYIDLFEMSVNQHSFLDEKVNNIIDISKPLQPIIEDAYDKGFQRAYDIVIQGKSNMPDLKEYIENLKIE